MVPIIRSVIEQTDPCKMSYLRYSPQKRIKYIFILLRIEAWSMELNVSHSLSYKKAKPRTST